MIIDFLIWFENIAVVIDYKLRSLESPLINNLLLVADQIFASYMVVDFEFRAYK